MRWKLIIWPVAIVILGLIGMKVLLTFRGEQPQRIAQLRPKIVNTRVIALGNQLATIRAFGRLKTAQPVVLYSEVSGILEAGDFPFQAARSFKKGDLLVKIDDRQIRLDLNSAKSDLLSALAAVLPEIKVDFPGEFGLWQTYFDRCEFDRKLDILPEVNNQKIKLYLSRFNVYKLYYQVRNLEILLNKHYIYAPFSGSIIAADLHEGSTARPGTRLGEIINLDNLEVEVPVSAQDIQWIDRQSPVIFTSTEIHGSWKGRISRIGKSIDETTQTVAVYMTVNRNGDENLLNGTFLEAEIPGGLIPSACVIPRKAIYNDRFVYLINQAQLEIREVDIARKEIDSVIVRSGLSEGDTLVVDVLQGVAAGMPARPKTPEPGD